MHFWRKNLLRLVYTVGQTPSIKLSERGEGPPVPPTLTHHLRPYEETGGATARVVDTKLRGFVLYFEKL